MSPSVAIADSCPKDFLLPQHQELLINSSVRPEIIRARGYRSVTTRSELRRLGFGLAQCNTPALVIPIWSVSGEIVLYQIRPDSPRLRDGKPVKYETPAGARMTLDVPPLARQWIGNPERPLFITEGVRKADAAVSQGLCCLALLGVWNWRGTNEEGGKVALPDWESVALKNRRAYIVFDSDVIEKVPVHQALVRLRDFLESRGAEVRVIYLPPRVDGGKVGLDDFFAAGHRAEDLLAHASVEIRQLNEAKTPASEIYSATPGGLVWHKPTRDGRVSFPLTNFDARIAAEVKEDDGTEVTLAFEIEARLNGKPGRFSIPAGQFASMNWAVEHLGAQAIVYPGMGTKDHARCAIQTLSGEVPQTRVYTHLGWRCIDGEWVYLHADGAIGKAGPVDGFQVQLPGALGLYKLPPPPQGQALRDTIAASLRFLKAGDERITFPLFASIWRAAMGPVDCGIHLTGPTGAGKSELAALVQQHWGPGMTARQLPGNWSSTGNALEGLAHAAKDALFTIDDFAPAGTISDTQRLHRDADRILRAQGNRSGRQRMRSDASLKPVKPPRGLILSTGEDVPRGQSLRARLLVLECSPNSIHWDQLTVAQQEAGQGCYAQTLAGFLQWLASRYNYLHDTLVLETAARRHLAHRSGQHRRTAQIVADLTTGMGYFLAFAQQAGCISLEEFSRMRAHCWEVLGEVSALQAVHHLTQEPAQRFLELLSAALVAGRAHVASLSGDTPSEDAGSLGWRKIVVGQSSLREEWQAQGERIGWLTGQDLYLEPEASFAVAQKLARDSGENITVSAHTLRRRLHERGYLASVEEGRQTLTVRRMIEGVQRKVLHLKDEMLTVSPSERADIPDMVGESLSCAVPSDVRFVRSHGVTEGAPLVPDEHMPTLTESKAGMPEQNPSPSCYSCGGTDFWLGIHGCRICRACHPPASPDLVARELTASDTEDARDDLPPEVEALPQH